MSKKPTVLMILIGYGLNDKCEANAVCEGKTPIMDQLKAQCPICKGKCQRYGRRSSGADGKFRGRTPEYGGRPFL